MSEKYDTQWFKKRAIHGLKKIEEGVWDYSDSLLLYVSSGVEVYEQLQEVDTPYFRLVTKPERKYLAKIAKDVVAQLPPDFDFIDLGPGTEHKEQFFFDELKKQGKTFRYIPVDISDHYLSIAKANAEKQGIPVEPMKASFEELPDVLPDEDRVRFVSLGLTFSNYDPDVILDLLKRIAGDGGCFFINAQMRDRVDMNALQRVYQDDAEHIADDKLDLLELDPSGDVSARHVDDGFRVWCTVQKTNDVLDELGIKRGDKLLVFQSLRYTKEQLEKTLSQFPQRVVFDTSDSFIAALIKAPFR